VDRVRLREGEGGGLGVLKGGRLQWGRPTGTASLCVVSVIKCKCPISMLFRLVACLTA
jgi:hypothetical protein